MCGEASFRDKRLTIAERRIKNIYVFEINDDDDETLQWATIDSLTRQRMEHARDFLPVIAVPVVPRDSFPHETFFVVVDHVNESTTDADGKSFNSCIES